jgi:hypothetical protein
MSDEEEQAIHSQLSKGWRVTQERISNKLSYTDLLIAILCDKKDAFSKVVALDEETKGVAITSINAF